MAVAPGTNPYDIQRNRIRSDATKTSQEQNDALKRRFARTGGLTSGSYLKAQERLSGQQEDNANRALEGVDVQEAAANEARAEAEKGRTFSREERLGSQQFAAGESALGRKFAAEESQKGREFTAGENKLGRELQESQFGRSLAEQQAGRAQQAEQFGKSLSEQQAARAQQGEQFKQSLGEQATARQQQALQFELSLGEQKKAREQQGSQFEKQIGQQAAQFEKQFGEDVRVTDFNMSMAKKKDIMDKIGDGAFVGGSSLWEGAADTVKSWF